jgi:hypothetical protein
MIEYGFYMSKEEVKELIPIMIELLDGTDDIYNVATNQINNKS